MTDLRVQIALQGKRGLPEDQFVNTWHADGPAGADGAYAANLAQAFIDFYLTSANSVDSPWAFLSNAVATNGHTVKVYALAEPEPRAPIFEDTFDLPGALSVEGYPAEVAICCSFRGAQVSGANMARRRGRIFFGPLKNTAGDLIDNAVRPVSALQNCLVANMEQLKADVEAIAAGGHWAVYSPSSNQMHPVVAGWVDNSFDTQRRRGEKPTARVTWE